MREDLIFCAIYAYYGEYSKFNECFQRFVADSNNKGEYVDFTPIDYLFGFEHSLLNHCIKNGCMNSLEFAKSLFENYDQDKINPEVGAEITTTFLNNDIVSSELLKKFEPVNLVRYGGIPDDTLRKLIGTEYESYQAVSIANALKQIKVTEGNKDIHDSVFVEKTLPDDIVDQLMPDPTRYTYGDVKLDDQYILFRMYEDEGCEDYLEDYDSLDVEKMIAEYANRNSCADIISRVNTEEQSEFQRIRNAILHHSEGLTEEDIKEPYYEFLTIANKCLNGRMAKAVVKRAQEKGFFVSNGTGEQIKNIGQSYEPQFDIAVYKH